MTVETLIEKLQHLNQQSKVEIGLTSLSSGILSVLTADDFEITELNGEVLIHSSNIEK